MDGDDDDYNDGRDDKNDNVVMVKTVMIVVQFDLYVGDSADDDDCGEGLSMALNYIKQEGVEFMTSGPNLCNIYSV